jgi:hypothetical protein
MIRIAAKRDGFRRGGIAHPSVPTEYPDSRFTPEELEQLQAEPLLVVEIIPDPDKIKKGNKDAA